MKARIGVSAVVALLLALAAGTLVEPEGDPSAVVGRAEEALRGAFASRSNTEADAGNRSLRATPQRDAFGLITRTREAIGVGPEWHEVEPIWSRLRWRNRQIAMARAMRHYDANPVAYEDYTWRHRHEVAARPWHIEEHGQTWLRRLGYAAIGAVVGFGVAFTFLALVAWSWAFLLARVRELSDAVRGK